MPDEKALAEMSGLSEDEVRKIEATMLVPA